ncbi:hypothetical protein QBC46DRAFT_255481 [Diplogelasinospora grovesii]|uniref:Uncharacterized protein n=1 Tax=Diplogelasinospora grovesii TaxID=303347 RepID=A0AAN6NET0_9PEZI|nr:hypothetical protein QBC46DRAFT_255481 [Diplogelasinospora grovesii]
MISFYDVQIVTGIGILVSAYGSLEGDSGISAYHWQIVIYLAWFANLTHLTCLTFLRKRFHRHTSERNWRVASMMILLMLLFVAEIPTAFFDWSSDAGESGASAAWPSSYARCFFDLPTAQARFDALHGSGSVSSTDAGVSVIFSLLLLIFSFSTRVIKVSSTMSYIVNTNIRAKLSTWLQEKLRHLASHPWSGSTEPGSRRYHFWSSMLVRPLVAGFLLCRLYVDLYSSMMSEVYWLWVSAIWGIMHISMTRSSAQPDESALTFGQILAIFLLVLPLMPIVVRLFPILPSLWRALATPNSSDPSSRASSSEPVTHDLDLLDRGNTYKAAWMSPTIFLAAAQVILLSAFIFQQMGANINAARGLLLALAWIISRSQQHVTS